MEDISRHVLMLDKNCDVFMASKIRFNITFMEDSVKKTLIISVICDASIKYT